MSLNSKKKLIWGSLRICRQYSVDINFEAKNQYVTKRYWKEK